MCQEHYRKRVVDLRRNADHLVAGRDKRGVRVYREPSDEERAVRADSDSRLNSSWAREHKTQGARWKRVGELIK